MSLDVERDHFAGFMTPPRVTKATILEAKSEFEIGGFIKPPVLPPFGAEKGLLGLLISFKTT